MLEERLALLKKNPLLNDEVALSKAIKILDRLQYCQWVESYTRNVRENINGYKAMVVARQGKNREQLVWTLLDLNVFPRIELGFLNGPFARMSDLLENESTFKNFMAFWPSFEEPLAPTTEPLTEPETPVDQPIATPDQLPKAPAGPELIYTKIVRFLLVNDNDDFWDWIEGKTFNGFTIRWLEFDGKELLGQGVWRNTSSATPRPPFECPKHLIDLYINALALATAEYHKAGGFEKLNKSTFGQTKLYSFGPVINVIEEKPGFFLTGSDPKIYFPETVPWDQLAEKGITVRK